MSVQPGCRTVATLAFHKIGNPPTSAGQNARPWYIPEETFRNHLRHLSSSRWEVISVARFLEGLSAPESLPQHAVLLTFDDAYKSLLDGASRCLGEFNYPAVVFTPTQFVGGSNEFDRKFNQPAEAICTWDDLRELDRRGFSVQSHGANHLSFGSLNPEQQEKELRESKAIIEAEVRKPVELFAYPFGHVPGDQQAMCELLERVGYRSAFCFGGGVGTIPNPRRYFLPRVDIYPGDDLANKLGS